MKKYTIKNVAFIAKDKNIGTSRLRFFWPGPACYTDRTGSSRQIGITTALVREE